MLKGRAPRKWPRRAGKAASHAVRDQQYDQAVRRIEALAARAEMTPDEFVSTAMSVRADCLAGLERLRGIPGLRGTEIT